MGDIAVRCCYSTAQFSSLKLCEKSRLTSPTDIGRDGRKKNSSVAFLRVRQKWRLAAASASNSPVIRNQQQLEKPSTYSSRIKTDIALYETPGASFDEYLEDKPRVFQAIFPDKRRSQRLNEEEWKVQMLPIDFMFLKVWPVVDMRLRCKTKGVDYPIGVPRDISKVLELDLTKWELVGLDSAAMPRHFSLSVNGALYPDRSGVRTRLKGQLEMKISVALPPMLSLVPEDVLRSVSEAVLARLVDNMKDKVNSSLLADYGLFRREKPRKLV